MSGRNTFSLFFLVHRPLLNTLSDQVERAHTARRPRLLAEFPMGPEKKPVIYTTCSFEEMSGEKLACSMSVLPQIDQLPNMFTYVSLQSNVLVSILEMRLAVESFNETNDLAVLV